MRMLRALLGLTSLVVGFGLGGCFDEPKPSCVFQCNEDQGYECPEGYACGDDLRCHLVDDDGVLAECEAEETPDAAPAAPDAEETSDAS